MYVSASMDYKCPFADITASVLRWKMSTFACMEYSFNNSFNAIRNLSMDKRMRDEAGGHSVTSLGTAESDPGSPVGLTWRRGPRGSWSA